MNRIMRESYIAIKGCKRQVLQLITVDFPNMYVLNRGWIEQLNAVFRRFLQHPLLQVCMKNYRLKDAVKIA